MLIGLTGTDIVQLMAKQIIQPLNHTYLPNLEKNIWPELKSPFYDQGSHYTVPYVLWQNGIGWRNDKIDVDIAGMDVPWDIFWQAEPWKGKVGLLDDKRDGLSMPMQRDAMRNGTVADLNTEDAEIIAKAGKDLEQLDRDLQHQGHDHGLPDAARGRRRGSTTRTPAICSRQRSSTSRREHPPPCSRTGARERRRRPERLLHTSRRPPSGPRSPTPS